MPKCDICNNKVGILDIVWLSDGKCCSKCADKSLSRLREFKSTIEDVKIGMLKKQSFHIAVEKLNSFRKEQYEKVGLKYEGYATENAFQTEVFGGSHLTFYDNAICFIEDGEDAYLNQCTKFMDNIDLKKAENIKFNDLKILRIPVNKVEYFCKEGDIQYSTKISGGGGGGTSISGAIIGGLIGGDAGAIIGSRKEVNPISSSVQIHDTSKTFLTYRNDEDEIVTMEFEGHDIYNYLLKKLPKKDLRAVQLSPVSGQQNSNADEIRKYKALLDDGIITQEEFDAKKKQLLGL